jgi:hypothetical protein
MNGKIHKNSKYQSEDKNKIKHIEQLIREEIKNEFKNNKNIYIYDKI